MEFMNKYIFRSIGVGEGGRQWDEKYKIIYVTFIMRQI